MTNARTYTFSRKPVRAVFDDAGIWIAATDLFALFRRTADRRYLSRFSPEHLSIREFASASGVQRLTAVSPLGACTIAKLAAPPVDRMVDAWVRRHMNELALENGLPQLTLTLLADGTLPIKPRVSHDNFVPWWDLHRASHVRQNAPNPHAPALFDADPILGAYDPASVPAPRLLDGNRRKNVLTSPPIAPERAAGVAELLTKMGVHPDAFPEELREYAAGMSPGVRA